MMNRAFIILLLLIAAASAGAQTPAKPTPVTYGLVIDCSGSVRQNLKDIRASATAIINANSDSDETFVTRFIGSDQIENIQELTSDKMTLVKSLDKVFPQGGQTAVVDGVWFAAHYLADHSRDEHRALVLITDGEDRASYYTPEQLLNYLKEKRIPVHILTYGHLSRRILDFVDKLARGSGGKVVFADAGKDLPTKAAEVIQLLRR